MNKVLTETLQVIRVDVPGMVQVFCNRKSIVYQIFRTALERAVRRMDI